MTLEKRCSLLSALLLLSTCCSQLFAGDEFAAWQAVNIKYLDTKTVDLVFYGELRESFEPRRYGGFLLSQQVKFPLHPKLEGGINYTYIASPTKMSDDLKTTQRAELDLTPHFKLGDNIEVSARQRFELRWVEGQSGISERTRHRLQLDFPIRDVGCLKSFFVNGEAFYDYTIDKFPESRIVPLGVSFKLSKKVGVNAFYMVQGLRLGTQWYNRHIIGTTLTITL